MPTLKQDPEDFIVQEIQDISFDKQGTFYTYILRKWDMTTQRAVRIIAKQNNIPSASIRYAGLKDRRAITSQYITSEKELSCTHENITIEFVGMKKDHLHLGALKGNTFTIVARDVTSVRDVEIPNYFGDQRFSTDNLQTGLYIVQKKWSEAAKLLANRQLHVAKQLEKTPNDPIRAMRAAPFPLLLLFVHAVQSYFWNEVVSAYLKDESSVFESYKEGTLSFPSNLEQKEVPLVGAAQELGEWEGLYLPLLNKHNIQPQDFIIRSIPGLTVEGTVRNLKPDIQNKSIKLENNIAHLSFNLGPGSYATICLKGWLT